MTNFFILSVIFLPKNERKNFATVQNCKNKAEIDFLFEPTSDVLSCLCRNHRSVFWAAQLYISFYNRTRSDSQIRKNLLHPFLEERNYQVIMASTGGVPYLGSKISLISKSEIRYRGILYTFFDKTAKNYLSNHFQTLQCHRVVENFQDQETFLKNCQRIRVLIHLDIYF